MKTPETGSNTPKREHYADQNLYNQRKTELIKSGYNESFGYNKTLAPDLNQDLNETAMELILEGHEVFVLTSDEQACVFYS